MSNTHNEASLVMVTDLCRKIVADYAEHVGQKEKPAAKPKPDE